MTSILMSFFGAFDILTSNVIKFRRMLKMLMFMVLVPLASTNIFSAAPGIALG